ncbi:MAG TPA: OmpA family protein [Gemmatimonadales bacterium]|nr:OmpA family protein [Gemmatimonadales bacterium]
MNFPTLSAALALIVIASPALAQESGAFEVGLFAQASYFDQSLRLDQARGGPGVRFSFFPVRTINLEAEAAYVPTAGPDVDVRYIPIRARVVLNVPAGEHGAILVGGGYVRNQYRGDVRFHDNGVTGLIGARVGLPGNLTVRVATYLDYIPSPSNGVGYHINWGLQGGLGFVFGRTSRSVERTEAAEETPPAVRRDTVAVQARTDSIARVRADSIRIAQAARDSVARAARAQQQRLQDSVRLANERQQALRDSLEQARRNDSLRTAALRDSLRLTTNRARMAALRDSLARVALRDSLRMLIATRESRVTLQGVNFELGKAVLLPISREILQDVARSLVANPEVRVEVGGHTDSTGSRELNERLSLARAESVKAFLIENGVAADRMEVQGYASTQPVATNRTASGRAQNRRVELRRID